MSALEAREKVDKLNEADTLIFQSEKQLKEFGDKLPADKKATIESAVEKLKEAHKAQDIVAIDASLAELNNAWQAASQDMYNASNQGGAQQDASTNGQQNTNATDDVQDAEVVEEVK